jgi:putative membrane protein
MIIMMSLQTIGSFALYFAVALVAVALFVAAYMAVTSHDEVALIKKGNTAAAISLGGALIGFTLPLASVIEHSVSIIDMAIWSAIALIVQLVVLKIVDVALREVSRHIEEGNVAAGTTLAGASIALGIVNAACMTY